MNRKWKMLTFWLLAALLLSGCAMRTVDQLYAPPKRSAEYHDLQAAIDAAMSDLEYSAPLSGENQQTVQMADLNGDGTEEYLLFAKGSSEMPMQILIFAQGEDGCELIDIIESRGSAFDLVEYVNMDDQPGLELIVGRQVSDQVLRSLSVYTFAGGSSEQLMTTNYYKFVTADLDQNDRTELVVFTAGETDTDHGVAVQYCYENGTMTRSREANLSEAVDQIKRIMVSALHGGETAVYVASAVEDSAIITDVFALKNGVFTNVSFSNESGTSVQTLRNYYVYADDIDNDGVLELPCLVTMISGGRTIGSPMHHLIRWYAMDLNGGEVDKMYTFHNFDGGWYVQLDGSWAPRVTVTQDGNLFTFSLWDQSYEKSNVLMSIHALTGANREEEAMLDNRFMLYKTEGTVYAAKLEAAAASLGITQESLTGSFHLIQLDWKTGETE